MFRGRHWFFVPLFVLTGCAWSSEFREFKDEHVVWKQEQMEAEQHFQATVAEQQQTLLIEARAIVEDTRLTEEEAQEQLALIESVAAAKIAEAAAKKEKEQAESDEVLALKAELAKQQSDAKTKATLATLVESTVSTAFGAKVGTAVDTALQGAVKLAVGEELNAAEFSTKLTKEVNEAFEEKGGTKLPPGTEAGVAALVAWMLTQLNNRRRNASRARGDFLPKNGEA